MDRTNIAKTQMKAEEKNTMMMNEYEIKTESKTNDVKKQRQKSEKDNLILEY